MNKKGDKMTKILYFSVIVVATILTGCATTTTGPVERWGF